MRNARVSERVTVYFNAAGLLAVGVGKYTLHLLVKPDHWIWGHGEDWYDGPLHLVGLGPAFLLTWPEYDPELDRMKRQDAAFFKALNARLEKVLREAQQKKHTGS